MFGSLFGRKPITKISQSNARKRLASDQNIVLLDVRTPEEYREIHIPNSISLPLGQLKSGIAKAVKNKDTEIFIYCLSGIRAAQGCRILAGMGYSNVWDMGALENWKYETERG